MSGNSGNLVGHTETVIRCPHGGRARPASVPSSGVRLDGQPVPTADDVFMVAGCPHTVDGVPLPCTTVRWTPDRDAVLIDGVPVLLDTSTAQCFSAGLVPQGAPVVDAARQGVRCG
ncbi:hypothetical protein ACH4S9_25410 [Streptomyces sp. NPDC021225]|uniref:hypothetical protein n=1 Tax=Streptomyces sp. NPDC021225 TaxID=3365121 RepID=UPI0037903383